MQHRYPATTTTIMVVVVAGVITVARAVEGMTVEAVAVHVPHPWIGLTATGRIIVVPAVLVSVALLHPALAPVPVLNVMLRLVAPKCLEVDSLQQWMYQWRSVHVR